MAEGDTILRVARRIAEALSGEEVAVSAPSPRGRAAGVEQLDGRTLEAAEARGKHLLLRFGGVVLHSHLGMSGAWHVYGRGASWRKPPGAAWAAIREALLEQGLVAGIGNIFKSEACFAARQDPWQMCHAHSLARPGRRQPHHLLVSSLPGKCPG